MHRIEIIGASYVGKSTLLEALDFSAYDNIFNEQQLMHAVRRKIGYPTFIYRRIMQSVLGFFNIKFDAYKIPKFDDITSSELEEYKHTLSLCFNDKAIEVFKFEFIFQTYRQLLKKIFILLYYDTIMPKDSFFLAEESLLHWHHILHELFLREQITLSPDSLNDKGLFPKALIYCYADKETISERLELRKQNNSINKNHLNKTFDEVIDSVMRKQQFFFNYSKFLEKNGVKVLYLDTIEELNVNIQKVNEFLNSISF